eukprot:COSAG05_NODE_3468_length_2040_cov_11.316332_2_plen_313_part_00
MGRSYGYGDGRARTGFQGVRGRDSRECAGRLLAGASILLVLGALQIAATPAAAAASPARAGAAPTATEGATAATGSARASFPDLWSELLAAVGDGETIGGVKPWRLHGDGDEEGQWVYVLGWTADEVRAHSNAWGLMRYKMWPYFKGLSTLKKMGATTVVEVVRDDGDSSRAGTHPSPCIMMVIVRTPPLYDGDCALWAGGRLRHGATQFGAYLPSVTAFLEETEAAILPPPLLAVLAPSDIKTFVRSMLWYLHKRDDTPHSPTCETSDGIEASDRATGWPFLVSELAVASWARPKSTNTRTGTAVLTAVLY